MLSIKHLKASVDNKTIIHDLNLEIQPGEVHAIMGPNGSGKSTLANILAGRSTYHIEQGSVAFLKEDLLSLAPEMRARKGLFLAFQYPIEIPGVTNIYFLKASLNAIRKARGESELDAFDFTNLVKSTCQTLKMSEDFLYRPINTGFSGGEKKRNAILQMMLLEPKLAILDEADSGLDVDALRIIAEGVNAMRAPHRSFLLITHYQRLLDYIVPDVVHILLKGKIIQTGGPELAHLVEKEGYENLVGAA
jgi:Fe-S cluster assembly ATP-binding protein